MSGLYNILFGVNRLAAFLLDNIHVDYKTIPRFQDCFLNEAGDQIIIYTRTGGGNRDKYQKENETLRAVSGYLGDDDDSFDSTYALFRYSVPEQYDAICKLLAVNYSVNPAKRWAEYLEQFGKGDHVHFISE